ncbi:hypothetical protein DJ013_01825 [Arcticibacterium luteifluviistationis]|uniref:Uncharacterized protein n=1 Tax=Arcticibacterium luteifluviistationis TaxID=1784714 RepID=A0A2Z4G741_9BACT|nr:hypothetical protein DJ013_01825 [Arcticibacterium luteifluviistationis]
MALNYMSNLGHFHFKELNSIQTLWSGNWSHIQLIYSEWLKIVSRKSRCRQNYIGKTFFQD